MAHRPTGLSQHELRVAQRARDRHRAAGDSLDLLLGDLRAYRELRELPERRCARCGCRLARDNRAGIDRTGMCSPCYAADDEGAPWPEARARPSPPDQGKPQSQPRHPQ